MKTFLGPLLKTLLAALFFFATATDLHAAKQIGVILTGDIPYYRTMHETFVAEINKRFTGDEKIEFIVQKPFPDPMSWSNAARKLIAYDVDLIISYGSPATQAVLHEKSNIPLLYVGLYEPDQAIVTGRNVTGCGFKVPLSSIIRYFKHLRPVKTLGIVFTPAEEDSVRQYKTMTALAAQQNIKTEKIEIGAFTDLDKLKAENADAVFITGSSLAHLWIKDILSLLKKRRLPTADIFPDDSESGVLLTLFQPSFLQGKMAAEMAAQILLNKKPDNIPAYTSRETELVYNLVEARELGITIPIDQLIDASRVIK